MPRAISPRIDRCGDDRRTSRCPPDRRRPEVGSQTSPGCRTANDSVFGRRLCILVPFRPPAVLSTSTLPAARPLDTSSRLGLWKTILATSLEERLVYRGDFALGTLMRFLPIITQIFLWYAIFDSIDSSSTGQSGEVATESASEPTSQIGGFGFREIVAYYLLTMIARAFSSMPGLASGIAKQIREGEVKRYLIQPIDWIGFLLLTRIAHKLAYYAVAILPFALVFFLCRGYFDGWPPPHVMGAFIGSLLMGFAIGFFIEASIGMIGFWFLEVTSLLFVFMLFSFFLSGHMFPLDLLPPGIETVVQFLPFKYLAYFPAAVFLEKIPEDQLPIEMAVQAGWLAFFIIVCRVAYARGVRRYSGFGG